MNIHDLIIKAIEIETLNKPNEKIAVRGKRMVDWKKWIIIAFALISALLLSFSFPWWFR